MRLSFFISIVFTTFALFAEEELPQNLPAAVPEIAQEMPTPAQEIATPEPTLQEALPTEEIAAVSPPIAAKSFKNSAAKEGYTINYNTVSVLEYLRFASKICNTNFIFNDADLDFTVTVVSDAPITPENVMSTLVQVLRVHGLELLEQDNNLVLHKSADVKQMATLITGSDDPVKAAIVTRIFRLKYAKADALTTIIRPMISGTALLEALPDTHQLIITDVRTNVDKVAQLIDSLDSPATPIEIKSYDGLHNTPEYLIPLLNQIMAPIIGGQTFVLVPHPLTNSIYIISSHELIEKAMSTLKTIDIPPRPSVLSDRKLKSENFFVYKPMHRTGSELLKSLGEVAENLKRSGMTQGDLIPTIDSAHWISESNSILFVGTKESLDKIKELLGSLDMALRTPGEETSFFIYRPQNRSAKEIQMAIQEMARNLKDSKITDQELLQTLSSAKLNENANSLTFSGEEKTFAGAKELLSLIDVKGSKAGRSTFYLYKPQHTSPLQIEHSLKSFAKTLDKTQASDQPLIDTIQNMQIVDQTNSILFTGTDATLKRLEEILPSFDVLAIGAGSQFFIYKPKTLKGDQLASALKDLTENLQASQFSDPALLRTLQSVKYVRSTNSFLFTGDSQSMKKVEELLASIDTPGGHKGEKNFILYEPKYASREKIETYIKQLSESLGKKGGNEELLSALRSAKWVDVSHSFLFNGNESTLSQVTNLLQNFDTPSQAATPGYFLYKLQNADVETVKADLDKIAQDFNQSGFKDSKILDCIRSANYIKETNSILLTGDPKAVDETKQLISQLDYTRLGGAKGNFFLYKPQHLSGPLILKSLQELADNLKQANLADPNLINAINSAKYVETTRSIVFTGSPDTIQKIQTLLKDTDVIAKPGYYLYKLQNTSIDAIKPSIDRTIQDLSSSGVKNAKLVECLKNIRYVPDTQSLLITGDPDAVEEAKEFVAQYDSSATGSNLKGHSNFFMYKPQYVSASQLQKSLKDVVDNMKKSNLSDPNLISTIDGVKYVESTQNFLFTGTPETLQKIQGVLKEIDTPTGPAKPGYFLYKVQNTTGDVIEEDLDNLVKNFSTSGLKDAKILDVIRNIRYIKETNSLLLTGDPKAIEETKQLVSEFDYPRAPSQRASNFFMYKPQHASALQIQKSLRDIADSLKKADLADPDLLTAIETSKYVETTNALIFTGSPSTIQKIQNLLKDIDLPATSHAPIQHVGKTTFLLYKLKNASGPQIVTSLQNMLGDLKKSGESDKDFLGALNSMKYIRETNSLLFTGNEEALKRVELLVSQFDVTSLAAQPKVMPSGPTEYFLYKPLALSGTELEQDLQNFAENLKMSGHNDPDLYAAISSTRWIEKTQNLMFTGTPKALGQIKDLLKSFDVQANLPATPSEYSGEPTIQAIDNTSFLVYKLQFHKGDEIQGALRQIAKDLISSNAPINQNLLNSINSIQWLEVTNSLLCSGDQETLTRLRELVKNLDVPLKQVFIEVLVIETTLTNALAFGLEWGSNFNFRNKYSASMFNTDPQVTSSQPSPPSTFDTNLGNLQPPNTPTPQLIPVPAGGFDLGVIGEVIKHNGKTYLTLGSLLKALQQDSETIIVMTPKILTQDGRTSSLFQGRNIPFLGSFVNNSQSSATVQTANIEYRDIGFNFTVTPVLGNSDIVTLDIAIDQSQTLSSGQGTIIIGGQSVSSGITTSKTTMQTTVHVPDRHFLILSGMVNNSNTKVKTGIPCLGGLPLIGAAFSSSVDTISNTNIVIFLRPHILTSVDDMKVISKDQEEFFRDQGGTPFLEHNYDEAMDTIKSYSDE